MPPPDLDDLLDRVDRALGHWTGDPAGEYSQWSLRRLGARNYEIRTIDGDVGRGDTRVDAVQDLLAYLPT